MKIYAAPLEGITGYVFRNAFHSCFDCVDKYFIPFINPNQHGHLSSRERQDILPENNQGMYAVPQILTNCAEDFLRTAKKLSQYGYTEINLNLGCPSKTVVTKGRGSGFLAFPEELDRFLDEIYRGTQVRISIKTRIGKHSPDEFGRLLKIYNQYPVEELIIHPRLQQDFYKNTPNLEVFAEAVRESRNPLCYNGDIFSVADRDRIKERFPDVKTYMMGRGILVNPGLAGELAGEEPADWKRIRRFHDQIYEDYQRISMGDKNVLFKMKELWCYLGHHFPGCEKQLKKIRKAERLDRYEAAVAEIL